MPTAFCPGHITCFFAPGRTEGDLLERGSTGVGIRTSPGATVEVTETSGTRVSVIIDGTESDAPVTREVLRELLPGRGADVIVTNGLPLSQGFGMSAAGAVATALCAASIAGFSEARAWEAAHRADIVGGGGLGDVSAISLPADVPVRRREGLPPRGEVVDSGVVFPVLSAVVLGPRMNTGAVLSDPVRRCRIAEAGRRAIGAFDGTADSLFEHSNVFSRTCGIESPEMASAIAVLRSKGYRSGMCMLGNSLFTDSPADVVVDSLPDAEVCSLGSTAEKAAILRE